MKKPYIVCHMMAALDGRIDCGMTVMMYVVEGECEISLKYNTAAGLFVNFL